MNKAGVVNACLESNIARKTVNSHSIDWKLLQVFFSRILGRTRLHNGTLESYVAMGVMTFLYRLFFENYQKLHIPLFVCLSVSFVFCGLCRINCT